MRPTPISRALGAPGSATSSNSSTRNEDSQALSAWLRLLLGRAARATTTLRLPPLVAGAQVQEAFGRSVSCSKRLVDSHRHRGDCGARRRVRDDACAEKG